MRYLAVVAYDGTNYQGWQIQRSAPTVEAVIEEKISKILDRKTKVYGSGRTDAGVHALGQAFHFDADIKDTERFRYSLNCLLPPDIHVVSIRDVAPDFHARLSARSKTYVYRLGTKEPDVFQRRYRYEFRRPLDVARMGEASLLFLGKHDLRDFTSKKEDEAGFVRTILDFSLRKKDGEIVFAIKADGFMRYEVRMIVGVLIEVGLGKLSVEDVKAMIDPARRHVVAHKAPPEGLLLFEVDYD